MNPPKPNSRKVAKKWKAKAASVGEVFLISTEFSQEEDVGIHIVHAKPVSGGSGESLWQEQKLHAKLKLLNRRMHYPNG